MAVLVSVYGVPYIEMAHGVLVLLGLQLCSPYERRDLLRTLIFIALRRPQGSLGLEALLVLRVLERHLELRGREDLRLLS